MGRGRHGEPPRRGDAALSDGAAHEGNGAAEHAPRGCRHRVRQRRGRGGGGASGRVRGGLRPAHEHQGPAPRPGGYALRQSPWPAGSHPAHERPGHGRPHRPPRHRLPGVAHHPGGKDLRLPRARVQPAHPALRRSRRRAGAEDRLHQRGRLQPGHRRLARGSALPAHRAGRADPQPLLPRRAQAPPVRLHRQRAGRGRRATPPSRSRDAAPSHAALERGDTVRRVWPRPSERRTVPS